MCWPSRARLTSRSCPAETRLCAMSAGSWPRIPAGALPLCPRRGCGRDHRLRSCAVALSRVDELAERPAVNRQVIGSSPIAGATLTRDFAPARTPRARHGPDSTGTVDHVRALLYLQWQRIPHLRVVPGTGV